MVLEANKKKANIKLNRKQHRKEKRKVKKAKRNEYFSKRTLKQTPIKTSSEEHDSKKINRKSKIMVNEENVTKKRNLENKNSIEDQRRKEKKQQQKLAQQMAKQRKEQLLKANLKEDQVLKILEKQLKLNKKKNNTIPKSFVTDGLAYVIEATDTNNMKNLVSTEQDLNEVNDEFEEDFKLMTGYKNRKNIEVSEMSTSSNEDGDDSTENFEELLSENYYSDEDIMEEEENEDFSSFNDDDDVAADIESHAINKKLKASKNLIQKKNRNKMEPSESFDSDTESENEHKEKIKAKKDKTNKEKHSKEENKTDTDMEINQKRKFRDDKGKNKKKKLEKSLENDCKNISKEKVKSKNSSSDECDADQGNLDSAEEKDKVWEDIYGRLRSKDGIVINKSEGKYIPPSIRAQIESNIPENERKKEKLEKLKKQLKGLLNRLAERNMYNIASQIEDLYMNNSRNDMNQTITTLIMESLVSNVLTPERLLMEHVSLITILHANVGTEVGAHFLQTVIEKFNNFSNQNQNVEDKSLDNIVNILAQLYNFKVFDATLLYEILQKLSEQFKEKNVECILHILKSVGFGLRKDDPIALKNLILQLQKQASTTSEGEISNSRVKFLLDILLAIKNNNVTKIPNYDTTYSEHLKKIMKGFIRKGNYVTQLNITLEDLLNADERGRWWVVGSAWSGNSNKSDTKEETLKSDGFSKKLLDLARKQRMNTDVRRDIFCIIMSAEDYLDTFEKLLKLGLKNQQERDIIHVVLHCCLQEKVYNPYYAVLAQKFCEFDRKFQMTIKCSVWDKLKILSNHSGPQISNLAKLLTHLFIEKGLPISTLKIVEFSELDKVTLRFIRQILLGILLHNDIEALQGVFAKVIQSDKLKLFRESLRLFIHHFLLRNLKAGIVPDEQKHFLEERVKIVEKILTAKDTRLRL